MQKPEGLILDFDGVFYSYEPHVVAVYAASAARAAIQCGVPQTYDNLYADFCLRPDPHAFSEAWQVEHGLDILKYHHAYHDDIPVADAIGQHQPATAAFSQLADKKVPMVILTHGSRPWVKRVLAHIGLPDFLPDTYIIGFEHTNRVKKNESAAPVQQAAALLGIAPDRLGMIEDSHNNLVYAHELGVHTGYVHYGKPLAPQPAHVRHQSSDVAQLVRRLGF